MTNEQGKLSFFTRDRSFYQRFFSMLFFIALQNLIVYSVNLADNIMLGSYSETALAGAALVNQIYFLLQMIVSGCGEGMIVLTAQYWGTRDISTMKKVCSIAMRIALAGAGLLMAVSLLWPEPILSLLTNDAGVVAEGAKYLRILALSYLFFAASNMLTSVLRSAENVRIGMVISVSALVVNVSLNWCLIFGNLGFPRMGIEGAAIATLTSRVVEMLIAMWYVRFKEKHLGLRLRDFLSFDRTLLRDLIRTATPAMVTSCIWGLAMLIQSAILGHLGASATAASSVAGTVFSILTVVVYGATSASGVIIGNAVGAGQMDRLRQYSRTLQVIFLIFGAVTGILLYLSRDFVLTLYADLSAETQELAMQFMTVLSVTVVGTGYQSCVLGGIVKAGGSPRVQMVNDMISMWGIVLPISLLAAFVWKWPPVWVFFCLKSDQLFKCGTAAVVCNRYRWAKRLVRE